MDTVLQTALLGTEKHNLELHALPKPVQDTLNEGVTQDSEHQFLQAITLATYYQTAGNLPKKISTPQNETIIQETQNTAPEELLQIFGKFELVNPQIQELLLNSWLKVIQKRNEIVGAAWIVDLIHYGKQMSQPTRSRILEVIGNKGRWILQYDSSLNYPIVAADDQRWQEGTTAIRKNIFTTWRNEDRVKAWTRLQETWEAEPIASKKMFLEIILQTAASEDIPHIEQLYDEEFKYQDKEKKTEKECRRLLASILLRFSGNKLYKQTTEHLEAYFTKGRTGLIGMITGKENVSFQLPDSEDAFWNASVMEQQFGFEIKSYDIARFHSIHQFWLSHFLQYIPMTFWSAAFNADYTRTVQYWLTSTENQTKINGEAIAIYKSALIANMKDHQDKRLAAALVNLLSVNERVEVLPHMSLADYEEYVDRNNFYDYDQVLQYGPYTEEQYWPLAFSIKVINEALEQAMHNNPTAVFGKVIAHYAHPDSISTLYECNNKAQDKTGYNNWNNHIFQVAQAALEIRSKINFYNK
ncbi:MAG: hypothetical protein EBR30_04780 [Cytophagia bacterium]|nr:hypothetical protein [Cytophagia bacterium]